ncbi:hypothetical protein Goshw_023061, partial [Gossypium schwendimanii]|nr:hypothetical protein [Gossypium schwendimanii]
IHDRESLRETVEGRITNHPERHVSVEEEFLKGMLCYRFKPKEKVFQPRLPPGFIMSNTVSFETRNFLEELRLRKMMSCCLQQKQSRATVYLCTSSATSVKMCVLDPKLG